MHLHLMKHPHKHTHTNKKMNGIHEVTEIIKRTGQMEIVDIDFMFSISSISDYNEFYVSVYKLNNSLVLELKIRIF